MKKTTCFLLMIVMLATALLSSACAAGQSSGSRASDNNFSLYYSAEEYRENAPTTAVALPDNVDQPFACMGGDLAFFFRPGDTAAKIKASLTVYDLVNEHVVLSEEAPATDYEALEYLPLDNCFAVRRGSVCNLYDRNGKSVAEVNDADTFDEEIAVSANMVLFDCRVYCFDDNGEVNEKLSFDAHVGYHMPYVEFWDDNYYYAYADEGRSLLIYDKTLTPYARYELPAYIDNGHIFYADEGAFIIQYTVKEAEDATDYTYLTDGNKYTLKTLLYDVSKDKLTEKSCNYVIKSYHYIDSEEEKDYSEAGYKKNGLHAFSYAAPIKDGRPDEEKLYYLFTMFSFDEDSQQLFGVKCGTPYFTGKHYIFRAENFDCLYLTDDKGQLLSTVSAATLDAVSFITPSYIVTETVVYDYAWNVVFELTESQIEDGMTAYAAIGDTLYFADVEDTVYRLKIDGKQHTFDRVITAGDVLEKNFDSDSACYYTVKQDNQKIAVNYYNENGDVILENLPGVPQIVANVNGRTLLALQNEKGELAYYLTVQKPAELARALSD